ncbi:alpha/beta hydrolase family protein [Candidatus Dependentiae bacterium]
MFRETPKPTGPHKVGKTELHFVDENRDDPHVQDLSLQREFMVKIWYPADANSYFESNVSRESLRKTDCYITTLKENLSKVFGMTKSTVEGLTKFKYNTVKNAKLSKAKKQWPALIFSHGLGTSSDFYSIFLENIASHGYIVVAIDHTFSCDLSIFPGMRKVYDTKVFLPRKRKISLKRILSEVFTNVDDVKFVIKELKKMNNADDENIGKYIDLDKVGIFGHSLGSSTAIEACRQENNIKAAAGWDGWVLGTSKEKFNKPVMILHAGTFDEKIYGDQKDEIEMFCDEMENLCTEKTIKNAKHMAFTNAVMEKSYATKEATGSINPYKAVKQISEATVEFFDKHLKERTSE